MLVSVFRSLVRLPVYTYPSPSSGGSVLALVYFLLFFFFFFAVVCWLHPSFFTPYSLTFLFVCSCTTLSFSFLFPLLSLSECVYTKTPASHRSRDVSKINNTECHSLACKQWISAHLMLSACCRLVFSSHSVIFPLTLCFRTQWRPFLPGLKYEVIDSAYISLYAGKSCSTRPLHCSFSVVLSNRINFKMDIKVFWCLWLRYTQDSLMILFIFSLFIQLRACQIERGTDAIKKTTSLV